MFAESDTEFGPKRNAANIIFRVHTPMALKRSIANLGKQRLSAAYLGGCLNRCSFPRERNRLHTKVTKVPPRNVCAADKIQRINSKDPKTKT